MRQKFNKVKFIRALDFSPFDFISRRRPQGFESLPILKQSLAVKDSVRKAKSLMLYPYNIDYAKKKDNSSRQTNYPFIRRDDTTRTCDPLVPNQVYYQLYYIPKASLLEKRCKVSENRGNYQIYLGNSDASAGFYV